MRTFLIILLAIMANSIILAQNIDERGYLVKIGDTPPDFEMLLTDGSKV